MRSEGFSTRNLVMISAIFILAMQIGIYQLGAQSTGGLSRLSIINGTSIYQNSSLSIPFSVNLTSGNAGTTYLIVGNGQSLQGDGIYVGFSPGSGTPNFSGDLYINTNEAGPVAPGVYTIMLESGGADPVYPGIFNFTLTVLNTKGPTNQTNTVAPQEISNISTVQSTIVSGPQQTASYPTSNGVNSEFVLVGGLVAGAIIVAVVLMLVHKTDKRAKPL